MKTLLSALLLIFSTCAFAHPHINTVVIDTWWDHDFAKKYCNGAEQRRMFSLPSDKSFCMNTMVNNVESFERKVIKSFTASTACKRLKIYTLYDMPKGLGELWYNLSINFDPNTFKQNWQMVQNGKAKLHDEDGTAKEISKDVCSIIKDSS